MSKEVTTTEGNKLIAEFMGAYRPNEILNSYEGTFLYLNGKRWCQRESLEYHTSWDWLMPVVEKMADFGCWNIRPNDVRFEDWGPDKKFSFHTSQMDWERDDEEPVEFAFLVWHVAVKGIQWYNQNKNS